MAVNVTFGLGPLQVVQVGEGDGAVNRQAVIIDYLFEDTKTGKVGKDSVRVFLNGRNLRANIKTEVTKQLRQRFGFMTTYATKDFNLVHPLENL